jgi:PhzF family phenazine biosynthesis protein
MKIYQVDAFTDRRFAGNPAAVCIMTAPQDANWMQAVAAEMNLSETAFILPEGDAFNLRWFTPTVEEDLCGHATLASAHILWETGIVEPSHGFGSIAGAGRCSFPKKGIGLRWTSLPSRKKNQSARPNSSGVWV